LKNLAVFRRGFYHYHFLDDFTTFWTVLSFLDQKSGSDFMKKPLFFSKNCNKYKKIIPFWRKTSRLAGRKTEEISSKIRNYYQFCVKRYTKGRKSSQFARIKVPKSRIKVLFGQKNGNLRGLKSRFYGSEVHFFCFFINIIKFLRVLRLIPMTTTFPPKVSSRVPIF
jgi:hypothetical protein